MSALQFLIDSASLGGLYALFALSVALIFGVARVVNFANAQLIAIAAYAVVVLGGLPWPIVVVVAVATSVVASLLMERLVFQRMTSAPLSTLMVASLALSLLLQNVFLIVFGARGKSVDFGTSLVSSVSIGSLQVAWVDILTIVVTALLGAGLVAVLRWTSLGLQLRAASEDFGMARLLGVRARFVIGGAFAISGCLAAAAGLMLTVRTGLVTPDAGLQPVIYGFMATVIGGLGSITGAAAGGFLIGVATQVMQVFLPTSMAPFRDAFVLAVVVLVLLFRPRGLFSTGAAEERA